MHRGFTLKEAFHLWGISLLTGLIWMTVKTVSDAQLISTPAPDRITLSKGVADLPSVPQGAPPLLRLVSPHESVVLRCPRFKNELSQKCLQALSTANGKAVEVGFVNHRYSWGSEKILVQLTFAETNSQALEPSDAVKPFRSALYRVLLATLAVAVCLGAVVFLPPFINSRKQT